MQFERNKEMEFETLKKSYRKQIIIGALAVCVIGGALTFATSRAFYKVDKSINLAKGTINYKPYDFKIMAMYKSEDGSNYTEITDRMPASGYVINESKSYCTIDNKNKDTNAILKTIDGHHIIENLAKSDKCYLYFNKKKAIASETILENITPKITTPNFSQVATTDEGIYRVSDGMYGGTSYYWRGAVTNNYIKFAGFCWRIIRINGDSSIRLIYDGPTCHANRISTNENIAKAKVAYNLSFNQSNYVGWTYSGTSQRPADNASGVPSNAKTNLESWYSSNITETDKNKVTQGMYCNDRNIQSDSTWMLNGTASYYAAYKRTYIDYIPTLSCTSGDIYTLNVGLITADEIMYAGGCTQSQNVSYYLYNGQSYWTMSPFSWNGSSAVVYVVNSSGYLGNANVNYGSYDLRPVINLKSNVTLNGGDGTLDNPYMVE